MRASRDVRVLPDTTALTSAALEELLECSRAALAARGCFSLALAGGGTPRALYLALADASADFAQWAVFFGDERCVPPQHSASNYRMVREAWLDRAAVPPGGVHRVQGELDPDQAAGAYERELRRVLGDPPRLDLVLLGLGTDGHTASLFPGSEALLEQRRLVVATQGAGPVARRITLTLPALALARRVVLLVEGQAKAEMVRRALEPRPGEPALPVHAVLERAAQVLWLLDEAAAGLLGAAR